MANVPDRDIIVIEFELPLHNFVTFGLMPLEKVQSLLIPTNMG